MARAGAAHVAPLQAALLRDPIAFLAAEHARQTVLLRHLEQLAGGRAGKGVAAMVLRWLRDELPLHLMDEEHSLHPRLLPHDGSGTLARIAARHHAGNTAPGAVLDGLRALCAGCRPPPGFAPAAREFAAACRRGLALEEACVSPLARRVLDPAALAALSREMAQRRGLATP